MSNGPTMIGSNCVFMKRLNFKLNKKDWCSYEGECKEGLTISKNSLCWNCKYMKKFDIPTLIEEELKNGSNINNFKY
jgi:hypothetical protein